jgi:prepilin peptidase CpaA
LLAFLLAAVAISAIAAFTDYKTGQIPNWLTLGGIVVGVVGHVAHGWVAANATTGLSEGAFAIAGLLFCSFAPGLLYWKGGMGGGDLKLFAAIGALCQPMLGIEIQMYALVIAAVVAPARLAYEGKLFRVLGASFSLVFNPLRRAENRRAVPVETMTWFRLGPAIFGGAVTTLAIHGYAVLSRYSP